MSQTWIQHALQRSGFRPKRQIASLAVLGMFMAIFMGALYLSQSSSASTLGRQLGSLIDERDRLEQENEQLRAEIAGYRTVERLLRRAQELGFVQAGASDIQYIVVPGYDPNPNESVVPLEAEAVTLPAYDESFTGWLQQQWDSLRRQIERFNEGE